MQDSLTAKNRIDILGCCIDKVTMEQALETIEKLVQNKQPAPIVTLNAEIIYRAYKDQNLRRVINQAALITPDGIGAVWAGKILGHPFPERVAGIDLFYSICKRAVEKKWRIFLLGASPGIAEMAAEKMRADFAGVNICGVQDGYFKTETIPYIIEQINNSRPDILAVGLGSPKQEYWISKYKDQINVSVFIGLGGSFDVIAGIKKRAPGWIIRLNLEWLYRLIKEPSRFKRQLALPLFAWTVFKYRFHAKPSD
ncbi:MAG: WecB/TagA/CpsF family glycosyltransferase [Syntrophomonadaceae bacterium]|nr:WecB/TagA/CpsF family glycosyltransferase [Syntrophomonadaceae bacterium]